MTFLFVDRIVELAPAKYIRGLKHITYDDTYLTRDKTGRLFFPASLVGESLGQLAAWNVMDAQDFKHRPVAGVVARACFHRKAYVGDTLLLESFIDTLDDGAVQYHGLARINDEIAFIVEGAIGPLLSMHKFIAEEDVRHQFACINRPGDWSSIIKAQTNQIDFISQDSNLVFTNFMLFDSITAHEIGLSITAEKYITKSAAYFPDHFPRNPVLPMTILLESQINLAFLFLEQANFDAPYNLKELRRIKMNDFIYPGDIINCKLILIESNEELILRSRVEVDGRRMCVADIIFNKLRTCE